MHFPPSRRLLLSAVVALLIIMTGGLVFYRSHRLAGAPPLLGQSERSQLLENSLRAISDGERLSDRERWDADYVVQHLGGNPHAIFGWVRDNTDWIPYHGILRGPTGVLMDRQGNSLDRALLLNKLMRHAGFTVRLAHAELNQEQVEQSMPLLAARRETHAKTAASQGETVVDISPTVSAYKLTNSVSKELSDKSAALASILKSRDKRDADQAARLIEMLHLPDKNDFRDRFQKASEAFADHWWVQVQTANGWEDYDLTGIHAAPDKTAETTNIDPSLFHTIVIRLVVERASSGTLIRETAFEHSMPAFSTIGQRITMTIWPHMLPEEMMQQAADARAHFRAQAIDQKQWVAKLFVDSEAVDEYTIESTGHAVKAGSSGLGGLGAAIARMGAANDVTEMTAAWLEYEVDIPGEKPKTTRRPLFDLVGDDARRNGSVGDFHPNDEQKLKRSLALMRNVEILPMASAIAPEFVAHLAADATLRNSDILRRLVHGKANDAQTDYVKLVDSMAPMPGSLYGVALMRMRDGETDAYIDQPNILTMHTVPESLHDGIALTDQIDIVANEVGIGLGASSSTTARLRQGVRDTNAESAAPATRKSFASVSDAFDRSDDWIVVTSAQDPEFGKLRLSSSVQAKIQTDIGSGYIAVAPAHPINLNGEEFSGWWRIDPRTGATLGIGSNGMGGEGAERAALTPIQRAFLIGRSAMIGWMFAYLECIGSFTPSTNSSPAHNEVSGSQTLLDILLPEKLYAEKPTGAWCAKVAIAAGAFTGAVEYFGSVAWPFVVRTLKMRGYGYLFRHGESVADFTPVEDEAAEGAGQVASNSKKPCPNNGGVGLESEGNPALAKTQPGTAADVPTPPTPQAQPAAAAEGEAVANTPGGSVFDPATGEEMPLTPEEMEELHNAVDTRRANIEKDFQRALSRYREAAQRTEAVKEADKANGVPDDITSDARMQADRAEKTAARNLENAHNEPAAVEKMAEKADAIDKANAEYIDAWNKRSAANREFQQYLKNGGDFNGSEYDNWQQVNKQFEQARQNWSNTIGDNIPISRQMKYPPIPGPTAPVGGSAASGAGGTGPAPGAGPTQVMPNAPTIFPAKTLPLANSPTIACGNGSAPAAQAAGMAGAAQAVGGH